MDDTGGTSKTLPSTKMINFLTIGMIMGKSTPAVIKTINA
jgi:hypothetical protein